MEIGKAFTFLTEDEHWVAKLATGTALILISMLLSVLIVGIAGFFILAGYFVRLVQNVRDGNPHPLPEWDRWGDDLVTGLKLTGAILIYSLPMLLIMIPIGLGAAVANTGDNAAGFGFALIFCGAMLAIIYGLALAVAQAGIVVAFARDGNISSALDFRAVIEWTRERFGSVLVVMLVSWAVGAVAAPIAMLAGTILCVVGLIVTVPLAILVQYLIQGHLIGQLARLQGGSPVSYEFMPAPNPQPTPSPIVEPFPLTPPSEPEPPSQASG